MPASPVDPRYLEGRLLDDRFFVERLLGAGAFGAVYLAEQRVFSLRLRRVALKLFRADLVTPENAPAVLNDAVVLLGLQQEPGFGEVAHHLVAVHDAGFLREEPQQAFLAMEYVEGYRMPAGSVIHRLDQLLNAFQPVPVAVALSWMQQVARPLAWMHTRSRPILHCDLKPDNVLVCGADTLKLCDFGLARLTTRGFASRTGAGAMQYQAPETLMGENPTAAADVYALGLICYEILTGKNPFVEVGLQARAEQDLDGYLSQQLSAREQGLPSLHEVGSPEVARNPLLIEIVERCLRFRASERYDNASAVEDALARVAAGAPIPVVPKREKAAAATQDLTFARLLSEAQALLGQARYEDARLRCRQALDCDPRSGEPYRWLVETYLAEGDWRQGLQVCAEGRRTSRPDPDLLEAGARCYEAGDRLTEAARLRQEAAALRAGGSGR